MVFSSLLFIFVFLSISMGVYLFSPASKRNLVLLVASLLFYAWGGPMYLLLLLGETFISYWTALKIEQTDDHTHKRNWLIVECISLLSLLAIFKYTPLAFETVQFLFGMPEFIPQIILPIGISFYTFQLLSYVIDVYKGEVEAQPVFHKLLLYASLFHQCIAGPIVRYKTVAHEIDHRKVNSFDVYCGIRRFSIGLAKKAILANGVGALADQFASTQIEGLSQSTTVGLWIGLICYMMQIYLDFSAYSDMAVGLGRMVGFHYLENFNYPYQAISIKDFWRRWHISLSSFFRDYVYIPLGGNRGTIWIYIRNMIVVWFLTGLWHGASWNYVLWGVYYLGFLLLEKFVIQEKIPNGLNRLYTLSVIFFGWILFRYENMDVLVQAIKGLFGFAPGGFFSWGSWSEILSSIFLVIGAAIGCTSLSVWVNNKLKLLAANNKVFLYVYTIEEMVLPLFLLTISVLALIGNEYNPFLYFQF